MDGPPQAVFSLDPDVEQFSQTVRDSFEAHVMQLAEQKVTELKLRLAQQMEEERQRLERIVEEQGEQLDNLGAQKEADALLAGANTQALETAKKLMKVRHPTRSLSTRVRLHGATLRVALQPRPSGTCFR